MEQIKQFFANLVDQAVSLYQNTLVPFYEETIVTAVPFLASVELWYILAKKGTAVTIVSS